MSSALTFNPVPFPEDRLVLGKNRKRFPRPQDIDPDEYNINPVWLNSLVQIAQQQVSAPLRTNTVELDDQGASIGATDFSGGSIAAGYYQIQAYARIKVPATTGAATSSLTIAIGWTDGGVSQSFSFPAMTGNTTGTNLTGPPLLLRVDANSPITYTITYASNTAGQMKYRASFILSRVSA